jgi:phospholipase C
MMHRPRRRPGHAHADPNRWGYGPRQPLLVISPWAGQNQVDHALTAQSSVLRFIEDNWHLGRLGHQSSDEFARSLFGLFDVSEHHGRAPQLVPNAFTANPSTRPAREPARLRLRRAAPASVTSRRAHASSH